MVTNQKSGFLKANRYKAENKSHLKDEETEVQVDCNEFNVVELFTICSKGKLPVQSTRRVGGKKV